MCYTQHDVQEQELSLIREYESRLIARETIEQTAQLTATTAYSESLSHISTLLRRTLRLLNGEPDPDMPTSSLPDSAKEMIGIAPHTSIFDSPYGGEWDAVAAADWALERESELSRLEKENELLRRLAGIPTGLSGEPLQKIDMGLSGSPGIGGPSGPSGVGEDGRMSVLPVVSLSRQTGALLGGPKGTVGPFGTYKRMRAGHGG